VLLDFTIGDPVYPFHPVRLIGKTLSVTERWLWKAGANGFVGGVLLFLILTGICVAVPSLLLARIAVSSHLSAFVIEALLVYSLIALRDLLTHARRVEQAAARNDLETARFAISQLVGRDTARMDIAACRRAAIESISENLTDGWVSALFWYALGGLPGLLLFKVVSTMDSMVGYKTERYLRFGWCGARTDDVMNWIPARTSWLLLAFVAIFVPGCSARKALLIGWQQHAIVPGPNAGWSEATIAGAIRRKLIGPIWNSGLLVTDVWLGDPQDEPAATRADLLRAVRLVAMTGFLFAVMCVLAIHSRQLVANFFPRVLR
jgi:adenosylcobinamide-phosphate synthase